MSKKKEVLESNTVAEKTARGISNFLGTYQKVIIVVCIAVVLGLVILGICLGVNNSNTNKRFVELDNLTTEYSTMQSADPASAEYQSQLDQIIVDAQELVAKGGKKYPGVRAQYLLGEVYFGQKNYQAAMDEFLGAYAKMPKTYLGSLSLFNAAASAENLGNDALAMEYYQRVWDEYGETAAESPKALFGVARLYEKQGNIELAKATFQQLADQFAASEYGKLAVNKLIFL